MLSELRPRARLARVSREMRFLIFRLTRIGVRERIGVNNCSFLKLRFMRDCFAVTIQTWISMRLKAYYLL